jgi:hypothetical protein
MDAEGANNVAKSFTEFASRKAIQRQFGHGGYQVAANISDSDCDVLARSMTGVSSSSYIKGPPLQAQPESISTDRNPSTSFVKCQPGILLGIRAPW